MSAGKIQFVRITLSDGRVGIFGPELVTEKDQGAGVANVQFFESRPLPEGMAFEEISMSDEKNKPGLIVEDTTVAGGKDAQTGADVVRPKDVRGKVDESTVPTDRREAKK